MKSTTGVVYCHLCLVNGKKYIGNTIGIQWRFGTLKHPRFQNYKGSSAFYNAVQLYGEEAFLTGIIEDNIPAADLNQREVYWIETLNTIRPHGYNLTSGGERGKTVSKETRQKLSDARKARRISVEQRRKMSESHKGEKNHRYGKIPWNKGKTGIYSPETIQKMADARKGSKASLNTRKKMSESKKGKSSGMKGKTPWNKGKRFTKKSSPFQLKLF